MEGGMRIIALALCAIFAMTSNATAGIIYSACGGRGEDAQGDCRGIKKNGLNLFELRPTSADEQLSQGYGEEFGVTTSPDGKFLFYSEGDEDVCDLMRLNRRTGKTIEFIPEGDLDCASIVDWSLDGKWILFTIYIHDGPVELFKIRPDGSGRKRLVGAPREYFGVWDAKFTSRRKVTLVGFLPSRGDGIYTVRSDGKGLRKRLQTDARELFLLDGRSKVMFWDDKGVGRFENGGTFTASPNGDDLRKLDLPIKGHPSGPSPDGKTILYLIEHGNEWRISMFDLDSRESVNLPRPSRGEIDAGRAYWSPSGGKVAFLVWRKAGRAIYTLGIDGDRLKRRTDLLSILYLHAWVE